MLGCAVGDALGLPWENASAARLRGVDLGRYAWLGGGLVSDDTEQSALVLEALLAGDDDAVVARFRRALVAWFWRFPPGMGLATARACLWATVGAARTGVSSAGNGAAMRAGVLGVALRDDPARRAALGRRLAEVTHTDPRAVDGARYVAEVAAALARGATAADAVTAALAECGEPDVRAAVGRATTLAAGGDDAAAATALGTTGFVVHSVGWTTYALLRYGATFAAVQAAIRGGGDTDTHAAIVGTWVGASSGSAALPAALVDALRPGPFGAAHLRDLAAAVRAGAPPPRWSRAVVVGRNLLTLPLALGWLAVRAVW